LSKFEAAAGPVWWTNLNNEDFVFISGADREGHIKRNFVKVQNWFEARAKLGGNPHRISTLAPKIQELCLSHLQE
jgi:hypothetical protein